MSIILQYCNEVHYVNIGKLGGASRPPAPPPPPPPPRFLRLSFLQNCFWPLVCECLCHDNTLTLLASGSICWIHTTLCMQHYLTKICPYARHLVMSYWNRPTTLCSLIGIGRCMGHVYWTIGWCTHMESAQWLVLYVLLEHMDYIVDMSTSKFQSSGQVYGAWPMPG